MHHRRGRDAELPVAVHAHTQAECLAHRGHLLVGTEATPEMDVGENYVHAPGPDPWSELVRPDQAHVGGEGDRDRGSSLAHPLEPVAGILEELKVERVRG